MPVGGPALCLKQLDGREALPGTRHPLLLLLRFEPPSRRDTWQPTDTARVFGRHSPSSQRRGIPRPSRAGVRHLTWIPTWIPLRFQVANPSAAIAYGVTTSRLGVRGRGDSQNYHDEQSPTCFSPCLWCLCETVAAQARPVDARPAGPLGPQLWSGDCSRVSARSANFSYSAASSRSWLRRPGLAALSASALISPACCR